MRLEDVPELRFIAPMQNFPSLLELGSLSQHEAAPTRLEPNLDSTVEPNLFTVSGRLKSTVNVLIQLL